MGYADKWGKFSYLVTQLSTSDGKYYGFYNGILAEIPTGAAITKANFNDAFVGGAFGGGAPSAWLPNIGCAWDINPVYFLSALAVAETRTFFTSKPVYVSSSGTGAGVTGSAAEAAAPTFSTGTTATGQVTALFNANTSVISRTYLSSISSVAIITLPLLSTGTDRYTHVSTFPLGDGGNIVCTLLDSVNSGNYVVTYTSNTGSTTTLNTSVKPTAATDFAIQITATLSAGTWTLVIVMGGTTVLTTTATALNWATLLNYALGGAQFSMTKSVGTTARTFQVKNVSGVCT